MAILCNPGTALSEIRLFVSGEAATFQIYTEQRVRCCQGVTVRWPVTPWQAQRLLMYQGLNDGAFHTDRTTSAAHVF